MWTQAHENKQQQDPQQKHAQAPLRLISGCSFELDHRARTLVRELAVLCETPNTSIAALIERSTTPSEYPHWRNAVQYLAKLPQCRLHPEHKCPAALHGSTFPRHPEVTHGYLCARLLLFCGRRPLPFGGSHLCARLQPAHVTNDGYNETEELTMQSARPVREEWQPIHMSHLYQGEFFFSSDLADRTSTCIKERVRTLESFRRTGYLCVPTSQPRPARRVPIA